MWTKRKESPTASELNAETYARQERRAQEMQRRLVDLHARFANFDKEMSALDYKNNKNLENKLCLSERMVSLSLLGHTIDEPSLSKSSSTGSDSSF